MAIYGLSEYGAEEALSTANVLPSGTNKYVALLTTLPSARDGTGLVEATGSSYARVAHSAWSNSTVSDDTVRSNSSTITFPTLTGSLSGVVGWAIYSASTSGNLIAFGPLVDDTGVEITRNFISGDVPTFATGELDIIIGPC
jgi:hypothetical protein